MAVTNKSSNPFRLLGRKNRTANLKNHSQLKHGIEIQDSAETGVCPPRKLTEILARTARDRQVIPQVAVQAIAIADDPHAHVKSLVSVIAQVIRLSSVILSFATAAFSCRHNRLSVGNKLTASLSAAGAGVFAT